MDSASNFRDTKQLRKILHEEIRLGIKADSDLEEEEKVDLRKEIFPLGHYINDREEMIEEMFSLIKGDKLRKMLPPILKDMPLDELKADCLIHLLGMSKKRIFSILEGRQIDSSSDSESHSDSSIKPNKKRRSIVKPIVIKQEGCSDISDNPEEVVLIDPDSCESVISNSKKKSKKGVKRTKDSVKLGRSTTIHKKGKVVKAEEVEHSIDKQEALESSDSENDVEADASAEGKNLLELLELEMRARAIRALLHKGGPKDGENEKKNVSEEKDARTQHDSGGSAEDSDETENNKVTPAKNIRKRKSTNDDVIVVAPKLVTIDLTDEIDSRLKNKTPQKGNDIEITENKQYKSIVNKNEPILNARQEPEASKNDKSEKPEDSTNEQKSITLYDSKKEKTPNNKSEDPKSGLFSNKECAFEDGALDASGLSSNKECELEDGELDTKEDDHEEDVVIVGDNDLIENQPKDSELDIKDIVDENEDRDVKQSELIISESSVGKLSDVGETVVLSDDDSILSESNSVTNKDRTDQKQGKIIDNSEVGTSTSTSEHTSPQLVGQSNDSIKVTIDKKSWAQRWLDSKEVKKVVSTSKLCGSIRKRIKIAKLAKKQQSLELNQNDVTQDIAPPPQDIQGSVDEYQLLPKSLTVYNTEISKVGECNADQNEISSLNIPNIGSIPENANAKEQVQDVTSTDNIENSDVLDQSSDTNLNDDKGKKQNKQLPHAVIETNNCDQNKNESDTSIDQSLTLKTCDSSSRAVTHLEESDALLVQNENITEINTEVDTTSKEARINSPRHSNSEECINVITSENGEKNVCNDKLQTTKDKKIDDTGDLDQNGPETLEINITDEELEIDGIINDIIDPTNEDVVWSKNKIVEID